MLALREGQQQSKPQRRGKRTNRQIMREKPSLTRAQLGRPPVTTTHHTHVAQPCLFLPSCTTIHKRAKQRAAPRRFFASALSGLRAPRSRSVARPSKPPLVSQAHPEALAIFFDSSMTACNGANTDESLLEGPSRCNASCLRAALAVITDMLRVDRSMPACRSPLDHACFKNLTMWSQASLTRQDCNTFFRLPCWRARRMNSRIRGIKCANACIDNLCG